MRTYDHNRGLVQNFLLGVPMKLSMLGKSHAFSALAAWSITAPVAHGAGLTMSWATFAAGGVVCIGASLAPDMDHPDKSSASNSLKPFTTRLSGIVEALSGGHRMGTHSLVGIALGAGIAGLGLLQPWVSWIIGFFFAAFALRAFGFPWIKKLMKARTRTLLTAGVSLAFAVFLAFQPIGPWFIFAVGFGLLIHVLGDAITIGGVPWLWPVSKRQFRLTRMRAGSPVEKKVLVPLFIVIAVIGAFGLSFPEKGEQPIVGLSTNGQALWDEVNGFDNEESEAPEKTKTS